MSRIAPSSAMPSLALLLFLVVWCAAVADDERSGASADGNGDGYLPFEPFVHDDSPVEGGPLLRGRRLPDEFIEVGVVPVADADAVADADDAGEETGRRDDGTTNVFERRKKARHMTFCEKFATADREPEDLPPIRAGLANATSSPSSSNSGFGAGGGLRSFSSAAASAAGGASSENDGQQGGYGSCVGGFAAGGYECDGVDLASFVPLRDLNEKISKYVRKAGANDLWGWTDASSGREFVIIGLSAGYAFVEVSDPEEYVYMGNVLGANGGGESMWRDIKVYNNHAYMVSDASGHGLQVFDLRRLLPFRSNELPQMFSADARYTGFGNAHNIEINEASGYAYAVGTDRCNEGLFMISLRNPKSPTFAGCFGDDGYTHDVHCVIYKGPDSFYVGKEICFACNEDEVTIVDVTFKNSPRKLSSTGYSGRRYTHQGWLTEDHEYFVFGDEADEIESRVQTKTYIMDVTDLNRPRIKGSYINPKTRAIDHNQYIRGKHSFQANYDAGLRIMDVSSVGTGRMKEVGYFDVEIGKNAAEFRGAWSVYPFFPSGTVVVSSTNQGLYVLRPDVLKDSVEQDQGGGLERMVYRERFEFSGQGMAKARGVTRVAAPSSLRKEDGMGEYVGRVVIDTDRKTAGGVLNEEDWIDVPSGLDAKFLVKALIALANRKVGRIRFQPVLQFDNGSFSAGPWQALGNLAHQRWVRYESQVTVPRGAKRVKRVAVRTRNLAPNADPQVMYVGVVELERM